MNDLSVYPEPVEFKRKFWHLLQHEYPQFLVKEQKDYTKEYYFRERSLPTGVRFKYNFCKNEVSLIFEKKWVKSALARLPASLPEGMSKEQFSSELHIRLKTEIVDPSVPFEDQTETVKLAICKVFQLMPLAKLVIN
jgi:hypothetical protein